MKENIHHYSQIKMDKNVTKLALNLIMEYYKFELFYKKHHIFPINIVNFTK